ncbi:MAG: methylated-DNA--[protein]-cysteine S-methyltransferase [Treponema sp.]|nr:methylated-DNA--[protein]-cysteine S-methyltransferase [Treponema sp.]
MKSVYHYDFPFCSLGIAEENEAIFRVFFDGKNNKETNGIIRKETSLIKNAAAQLAEYFNGKRKKFDLPLDLQGTDFQITVWESLQQIPFGETRSYGEIAAMTGNPKASRAVGMANNRNPIAIIIPCHRVIGSNGSLTGYAGGIELKRQLLELEK